MGYFRSQLKKFLVWRIKNIPERQFVLLISVVIGFVSGLGAVLIKNITYEIKWFIQTEFVQNYFTILYFVFPAIGLTLTYLASKYILGRITGQGISDTLYAISKKNGKMGIRGMYSPLVAVPMTVGFGGSVGLEGATVFMGSSIGSNLARLFHLNQKTIYLMIGCATAGALASNFHAPIGAIIFAIEIFSLDLTIASIVPMLLASSIGALTSIWIYGDETLFKFVIQDKFAPKDIPFYILLGVVGAMTSLYFIMMYKWMGKLFAALDKQWKKLLVGSLILGAAIYFFPSLYGQGYSTITPLLVGKHHVVMGNNGWYGSKDMLMVTGLMFTIVALKVVATSATIGAVRVGGIFSPSLMSGCCMGYGFALLVNYSGIGQVSPTNFALVGMATQMAGAMHAPLTAIFMISELTGTYELMLPLMICTAISYSINKYFNEYNVYQEKLAQQRALMTHDKDKTVLIMITLDKVIETNFISITPDMTLREMLHSAVEQSTRNIYPVVNDENIFLGVVTLDDIRTIMFDQSQYDVIKVSELMHSAPAVIQYSDTMEDVMEKFQTSMAWNLPVCEDGKYKGFVSKSRVLSVYRRKLIDIAGV
ncbi:MAG TPA: chloride channel protein [Saprospiraceae bacterium]|jgi:CIC family chloride channel protein|nr:MAG: Cl- channel voltage-gated family protein [Candidatus Parvibacillus calidus]MBX2938117.1 chloride channel protein [Saprospiraceae bacterium]MBK7740685.1 chloride channel protein [Candidatus Parvibacillus calidus]MBX7179848.1 chloride channel protein [Saprospiraceae bacterium]MCB0590840.1 chloride channel protein [Saprospiraceae bacterium]